MTYLDLITPINIAEEKEKFFASKTYSPQFKYEWSDTPTQEYNEDRRLVPLANAIYAQDKNEIEKTSREFFSIEFRQSDIDLANKLIEKIPEKNRVTAEEYKTLAVNKFTEFGIDYKVEIVDKHGFQGRPDHRAKILRLSKYLQPEFYSVEGLVKHELVHIIRAINGEYNGIPVNPKYLATDEGLAGLIQDDLLTHETSSAFQHALEYLSALVARDAGFREVYDFLKTHGCSDESAWLRGIRQKFGICDTSKPGSLMKSGMSFYNELLIRELNEDEHVRLFVGKISPDDLPNYTKYEGKIPVEKILSLFK